MLTDDTTMDSWQEKKPPIAILMAAGLCVLGALMLLFFSGLAVHVTGYVLGSFVSTGLAAVFMKVDTIRRTARNIVYLEVRSARFSWSIILLAGVVACGVHAWFVASDLAAR